MESEQDITANSFSANALAVEKHRAGAWIAVILLAVVGPAISVAVTHSAPAAFAVVLVAVIAVGVMGMACSGFEYRFFPDGIEVRTLGFRLRWIPRTAILGYSVERWAVLRGYGIRGLGRTRAYVWGNNVVHVRTSKGEVFLGHHDPQRIMRDLDMVTGTATHG